jgi:hypothetical protein
VRRFVTRRRVACPDLYIKIEDQVAEEDRVVTRWRATNLASPSPDGPVLPSPDGPVLPSPDGPAQAANGQRCAGITIIRLLAGVQVDAHTQCTGPH